MSPKGREQATLTHVHRNGSESWSRPRRHYHRI